MAAVEVIELVPADSRTRDTLVEELSTHSIAWWFS
jgi:hypothetical protein